MFKNARQRIRSRKNGRIAVTLMLAAALPLTACTQASTETESTRASATSAEEGQFPVTLKHAFGETTVSKEPTRVLTLDSAAADTVIALGVTPAAMQKDGWAGDKDGFLPWTRAELEKSGQPLPTPAPYYSDSGELLFEQILNAAPDLILAPYSGFSEQDYQRLSTIAPTLPYDTKPYQPSSWKNLATDVGKALGRPAQTAALIESAEATIDKAKASHPEFNGVTFAFGSYIREGETDTAIYGPDDPRVQFVHNLGLTVAPDVLTGSKSFAGDSFLFGVSLEKLDTVKTDVYLGWASDQSEVDTTLANTLFARWPVIANGKDLWITDNRLTAATMYVSVLSIPWATDQLVPQLSALIAK